MSTTRFRRIFQLDISFMPIVFAFAGSEMVFNSLVISYRLLKPFTFSHARSQNTKYPLTRESWQVLRKTIGVYNIYFNSFYFYYFYHRGHPSWIPRHTPDFQFHSLLNVIRLSFFFSIPQKNYTKTLPQFSAIINICW